MYFCIARRYGNGSVEILLALFFVLEGAGGLEEGKGGNDIDVRNSLHFGFFQGLVVLLYTRLRLQDDSAQISVG